jgi:hypothetical protein
VQTSITFLIPKDYEGVKPLISKITVPIKNIVEAANTIIDKIRLN